MGKYIIHILELMKNKFQNAFKHQEKSGLKDVFGKGEEMLHFCLDRCKKGALWYVRQLIKE